MLIAFPWQQWSCERVSLLRFYVIASLVHNNIRSQIKKHAAEIVMLLSCIWRCLVQIWSWT